MLVDHRGRAAPPTRPRAGPRPRPWPRSAGTLVGVGRPAPAARRPAPRSRSTPRASRCCVEQADGDWHGAWRAAGEPAPARPDDADVVVPLHGTERAGAVAATALGDDDREVLTAFAAQLASRCEQRELRAEAPSAPTALAEANELRTALLAAVSHDLRTPLASIKASVTSLLQRRRRLHARSDPRAAGDHRRGGRPAQPPRRQPARHEPAADRRARARDRADVGLEEVRARGPRRASTTGRPGRRRRRRDAAARSRRRRAARAGGRQRGRRTRSRWSPADAHVRVEAGVGRRAGRPARHRPGPGIPPRRRERRVPSRSSGSATGRHGSGVGLGLAVARGFVEAMGGELAVEDTPGRWRRPMVDHAWHAATT